MFVALSPLLMIGTWVTTRNQNKQELEEDKKRFEEQLERLERPTAERARTRDRRADGAKFRCCARSATPHSRPDPPSGRVEPSTGLFPARATRYRRHRSRSSVKDSNRPGSRDPRVRGEARRGDRFHQDRASGADPGRPQRRRRARHRRPRRSFHGIRPSAPRPDRRPARALVTSASWVCGPALGCAARRREVAAARLVGAGRARCAADRRRSVVGGADRRPSRRADRHALQPWRRSRRARCTPGREGRDEQRLEGRRGLLAQPERLGAEAGDRGADRPGCAHRPRTPHPALRARRHARDLPGVAHGGCRCPPGILPYVRGARSDRQCALRATR